MSQIPFSSIFTIPIDGEDHIYSSSIKSSKEKGQSESQKSSDKAVSSYSTNDELNDIKESNETLVFSDCAKNSEIKSKANSSKIYMSEFLKHNWKIKSKRFLLKMQKKYIKKASKEIESYKVSGNNINYINNINSLNNSKNYFNDSYNFNYNSNNIQKMNLANFVNNNYGNCYYANYCNENCFSNTYNNYVNNDYEKYEEDEI